MFFLSVRQLHREFLRAGANVMQAFTFYASDDKLENRGQALKITVGAQGQHLNAPNRSFQQAVKVIISCLFFPGSTNQRGCL